MMNNSVGGGRETKIGIYLRGGGDEVELDLDLLNLR